ncbi:MAG: hypothetical protein P8Y70_14525 [Candidatus Lokiarchaeota archaeon]
MISYTIADYIQGGSSFVFVVISIIIGVTILIKYFEYRNIQLLLVGLVWIGISTPWFPDSINFIWLLLFSTTIPITVSLLLGLVSLPVVMVLWILVFAEFLYAEQKNIIVLIFIIIGVIYEIVFITLLAINPTLIGYYPVSALQMVYTFGFEIFLLIFIAVFLVTGTLFARESLRSDKSEIRLKGKFLLIAFISFTIGSILDSLNLGNPIFVIISRLILISSGIEFYIGFILPDRIKRVFLD